MTFINNNINLSTNIQPQDCTGQTATEQLLSAAFFRRRKSKSGCSWHKRRWCCPRSPALQKRAQSMYQFAVSQGQNGARVPSLSEYSLAALSPIFILLHLLSQSGFGWPLSRRKGRRGGGGQTSTTSSWAQALAAAPRGGCAPSPAPVA